MKRQELKKLRLQTPGNQEDVRWFQKHHALRVDKDEARSGRAQFMLNAAVAELQRRKEKERLEARSLEAAVLAELQQIASAPEDSWVKRRVFALPSGEPLSASQISASAKRLISIHDAAARCQPDQTRKQDPPDWRKMAERGLRPSRPWPLLAKETVEDMLEKEYLAGVGGKEAPAWPTPPRRPGKSGPAFDVLTYQRTTLSWFLLKGQLAVFPVDWMPAHHLAHAEPPFELVPWDCAELYALWDKARWFDGGKPKPLDIGVGSEGAHFKQNQLPGVRKNAKRYLELLSFL